MRPRTRRGGGGGWFQSGPKKPPPADGIKIKKIGTTWWGQRWIAALEVVLGADSGRLARGRTYARAGRTHGLVVEGGQVTAKVTGSRATPYEITMKLAQLEDGAWKKAIAAMAAKAQFSAELLAGAMPKEIDEAFLEGGSSLFPRKRADLVTSCSCPDWGDPCKHVAATHYVLGEALDGDPFLLFELRGRTRAQVLDALRVARGGVGGAGASEGEPQRESEVVQGVAFGKIKAEDYERAPDPLPLLQFCFDEPALPGAVLRQLGAPAGWKGDGSPAEVLSPLIRRAAEMARGMAMGDAAQDEPIPKPPAEPKRKASAPRKA